PLRITFEKNCISILCTTSIGKAFDTCNCSLEGETVEIGFHNRYLQDALKASGCEEIKLLLGGPLAPMRMVPLGGQNFLFLVLPVRLKTQG
ncbi:MAG: DNA polymerase III subunit beta, partial [Oscillospiraceae bacterium]